MTIDLNEIIGEAVKDRIRADVQDAVGSEVRKQIKALVQKSIASQSSNLQKTLVEVVAEVVADKNFMDGVRSKMRTELRDGLMPKVQPGSSPRTITEREFTPR